MAYEDEKKRTEDYYEQLKNENYKTLLDSQIQLENARQRASKQMGVGLAASGMDSSGYKGTINSGIENQYISSLQNSQNDFNQQNLLIEQNKQNALDQLLANEQSQNAQWVLNVLESGEYENLNQLYDALSNYGTYQDGKFIWNPSVQISDSDKARIESLLALKNANYEFVSDEETTNSGQVYSGNDDDQVLYYYNTNGDVLTDRKIKDVFKNETTGLKKGLGNGSIPRDSYVVLTNGWKDHLYLYIDRDGNPHYVDQNIISKISKDKIRLILKNENIYTSSQESFFNKENLGF